jgi:succinate dehydrogenase / fumarate reductase membrane anchor subunit
MVSRARGQMARPIVGAHYGLGGWLTQRVSAVIMAVYTLIVLCVLVVQTPDSYAAWKSLFAAGWMRAATLLFFAALLMHAWVGMRDILMDYIKPAGWRLVLEVVVILVLVTYAGWAVQILWRA